LQGLETIDVHPDDVLMEILAIYANKPKHDHTRVPKVEKHGVCIAWTYDLSALKIDVSPALFTGMTLHRKSKRGSGCECGLRHRCTLSPQSPPRKRSILHPVYLLLGVVATSLSAMTRLKILRCPPGQGHHLLHSTIFYPKASSSLRVPNLSPSTRRHRYHVLRSAGV